MSTEKRLSAAEAAAPDWSYGMNMERDGSQWLLTDPFKGLERFAIAWYQDCPPPVTAYTRAQYEAACEAAGIAAAPDGELGNYADKFASPALGEWPEDAYIALILRRRRIAGMDREADQKPSTVAAATVPATATGLVDRRALAVADMLGANQPATGNCHYCGLALSPRGLCDECI
jgi:hypothetical protein